MILLFLIFLVKYLLNFYRFTSSIQIYLSWITYAKGSIISQTNPPTCIYKSYIKAISSRIRMKNTLNISHINKISWFKKFHKYFSGLETIHHFGPLWELYVRNISLFSSPDLYRYYILLEETINLGHDKYMHWIIKHLLGENNK